MAMLHFEMAAGWSPLELLEHPGWVFRETTYWTFRE